MKIHMLLILVAILGVLTIFSLFGRVDSALEVDSLKEQIKLQREEMRFLENVVNSSISSCKLPVADFEAAVRANGHTVLWRGDEALVDAFRLTKKGACIVSINTTDWL